jgi:cobalt-zinc-cadmium resistance protein CzcA
VIIDAAIIQVENTQRHLSAAGNNRNKLAIVLKAVMEVRKPSIFGEFIIALTFVPIFMLQGMEGKMFTPLAFAKTFALFASLFLSILVIPALCSIVLKHEDEKESLVIRKAKQIYFPLLKMANRKKAVVIGTSVSLLCAAFIVIPLLGTEFLPTMDEGAFDMDIQLPPGTSLERSAMIADMVQKRLMQFEELETVVGKTGRTGIAIEGRGVERTTFTGSMKPRSEWKNAETREELVGKMREAIEDIPGIAYGFSQPIQCRVDELVAGTRSQIIVKLFGDDSEILKQKTGEISSILSGIEGATDILPEVVAGQPYISVKVDRDKIARHGINVNDVLSVIEITLGGKPASKIYDESKIFDLVLSFPDSTRVSAESIGEILIDSKQGYNLPLSQLADISAEEGPVQISRENAQRRMAIELNIHGRDIGSFVAEAQKQVKERVTLPAGYYVEWGGQFENQKQATKRLMIITPLVIGLIFLLLFTTFNSVKLAALVILNLPFALIGGVFALLVSNLYLSVPASVGFIVLFGIAVLNGLVLVSYISQLRQEGVELGDAVKQGCSTRLRPILMTALITIGSLIPMLIATGPGSEIQKPLATVVVGGIFTSTIATLLVLPIMYGWFERRKSAQDAEEFEYEFVKED